MKKELKISLASIDVQFDTIVYLLPQPGPVAAILLETNLSICNPTRRSRTVWGLVILRQTAFDAGHLQIHVLSIVLQHIVWVEANLIVELDHFKAPTDAISETKGMENFALLVEGLWTRLAKHKRS